MARLSMDSNASQAQAAPPPSNIFRSEEMTYVQVYMPQDAAHDSVDELGKLGVVQFEDLNAHLSAFQRPFVTEIKRCEEMHRKIRYFHSMIEQDAIPLEHIVPEGSTSLRDIMTHVDELEAELREATVHIQDLLLQINSRTEHLRVLEECVRQGHNMPVRPNPLNPAYQPDGMLDQSLLSAAADVEAGSSREGGAGAHAQGTVGTICGTIPLDRAAALDRVLFRVTRGNCVLQLADEPTILVDNVTGAEISKVVFFVYFTSSRVSDRIVKVVDSFGGRRFDFPSAAERETQMAAMQAEQTELRSVVRQTTISRHVMLQTVAQSLKWWDEMVKAEMSIYAQLNCFDIDPGRSGVMFEGWVPTRHFNLMQHALMEGARRSGSNMQSVVTRMQTNKAPPTHFETNRLSAGFQAIVEAYGVANYLEFNPTPFTVITFPFLFAVMFGDLGHGFLMFFFALFMLIKEKQFLASPPGEIFGICFGGRYVILLMSIFSIYTGFMYNETFSMAFDFFGSRYEFEKPTEAGFCGNVNVGNAAVCVRDTGETYKFGVDPAWKMSVNELSFTNGLKMKASIILGVSQMTFGILASAANHLYFRKWVDFVHQFLPQIFFLLSVFGYMVVLIMVKWGTNFNARDSFTDVTGTETLSTHCAPSILNTFINMFISQSVEPVDEQQWNPSRPELGGCKGYSGDGALLSSGQAQLQTFLLLTAFVCVPWMLLAKPLIERHRHRTRASSRSRLMVPLGDHAEDGGVAGVYDSQAMHEHGEGDHEEYDFAEEMVHNIIHTIEFVLGAVSNTASYLRLWALSLAHSQLGTVFWEKGVVDMLSGGAVMIVAGIFVWILCTMGVLMIMESLSAFLHALRLHWVEFQNKFYAGTGKKFHPFRYGGADEEET